jgi:hypothetical protein
MIWYNIVSPPLMPLFPPNLRFFSPDGKKWNLNPLDRMTRSYIIASTGKRFFKQRINYTTFSLYRMWIYINIPETKENILKCNWFDSSLFYTKFVLKRKIDKIIHMHVRFVWDHLVIFLCAGCVLYFSICPEFFCFVSLILWRALFSSLECTTEERTVLLLFFAEQQHSYSSIVSVSYCCLFTPSSLSLSPSVCLPLFVLASYYYIRHMLLILLIETRRSDPPRPTLSVCAYILCIRVCVCVCLYTPTKPIFHSFGNIV